MAVDRNNLAYQLAAFDGRETTILDEIEAEFSREPGYLDALIALARSPENRVAQAATWLIKSALEAKLAISAAEMRAYCEAIPAVTDWAAQLHVCQSFRFLEIDAAYAEGLERWLAPLLHHDRPFLRAWSLDALGYLAGRHRRFHSAFERALRAAESDPAASVRARVRNVRKRLG